MKNRWPGLILSILLLHTSFSFCRAQGREEAQLHITPAITHLVIDSLAQVLKHRYVFPDTAAKMAAYLEKEYKNGAYAAIRDPQELADRLLQDLQKTHHDGHLRLHYAPRLAKDLADTNGAAERHRIGDSLGLVDARQQNFAFTNAGILPGNIGYVKFNGFVGFLNEARPTFTGAFRFVANTKALIIDMRDNGGGSPAMVCEVASYFFPDSRHWNDIVGPQGKHVFYTDPGHADSLTLSMPVYILTSKRTFSGGEDFCYGMKSLHRAVIIGDTTGGGAHPVGPVPVVMGFVADIPFARSLNPYTQTDWEGTGVYPDIAVSAGMALDRAKQAILTDWVRHATTDEERMKAQWQLDDLAARQSQQAPVGSSLAGPSAGSAAGSSVAASSPAASSAASSAATSPAAASAATSPAASSAAASVAASSATASSIAASSLPGASSAAATSLAAYSGTYQGGLVFYVDHGDLYCKNQERGGNVFKLLHISGDRFVLDENVHVEFKKDDKGVFQKITMLWSNGRVSEKRREK